MRQMSIRLTISLAFVAALLCPLFQGTAEESQTAEKVSHFAETVALPFNIPKGTEISKVANHFQYKMMLRRDLDGPPLQKNEHVENLYLSKDLEANTPILRNNLYEEVPQPIAHLVPPRYQLLTLLLTNEEVTRLSLCGAYQRVAISLKAIVAAKKEDFGYAVGQAANEAPWPSIAVLAVTAETKERVARALKREGISLTCSRADKY